jgi:hypothetical protein
MTESFEVCGDRGMNKLTTMIVCALAGCILGGCGSSRTKVVSDYPQKTDYASFQAMLEREVSVGIDNEASDSGGRKLAEKLSFTCRIQPVGLRHSDSSARYRLLFEDVVVSRTDFLKELSLTDPVTELSGKSFEVLVDNEGRVVKADELLKSITALARGCESCPQGDDCGQRRVRDHNFLLDMWSIQELFFRAGAVSRKLSDRETWRHERQLPSVLPGESPSVTTEWVIESNSDGASAATGHETLRQGSIENSLPALHHPHVKPKGLLGYLRNCTYDSIKGHITLEASDNPDLPSKITREGIINATAWYTLSRPPQKANIEIWEKLTIESKNQ